MVKTKEGIKGFIELKETANQATAGTASKTFDLTPYGGKILHFKTFLASAYVTGAGWERFAVVLQNKDATRYNSICTGFLLPCGNVSYFSKDGDILINPKEWPTLVMGIKTNVANTVVSMECVAEIE